MVPGARAEARYPNLPLDHPVRVLLPHGSSHARLSAGGTEQEAIGLAGDAGCGDILIEILLQRVVAGHLVLLAALLVQSDPATPSLRIVVLHLHSENGVYPGEGVDHHADEGTVAQALERAGVDGVEQRARLVTGEHRRLAALDHVFRAADSVSGIRLDDMA